MEKEIRAEEGKHEPKQKTDNDGENFHGRKDYQIKAEKEELRNRPVEISE
jgi:hypothetical protein